MPNINYTFSAKRQAVTNYAEIFVAVTASGGKRARAKTKLYANPDKWLPQEQRFVISRTMTADVAHTVEVQKQLHRLSSAIHDALLHTPSQGVTSEWLRNIVDRVLHPELVKNHNALLPMFDEFLSIRNITDGRAYTYRRIRKALVELSAGAELLLSDLCSITKDLREMLSNYASPRTVDLYLSAFKTFTRWLSERGMCNIAEVWRDIEQRRHSYASPYYLTIEERDIVANADLSAKPKLQLCRDTFILQCHVGCRWSDLSKFRKDNVSGGVLQYIAQKTIRSSGKVIRVPLNHAASAIIAKYADDGSDSLLPTMSKEKYRQHLKELLHNCGITRKVVRINPRTEREELVSIADVAASHLARRTFVGNLYKRSKDLHLVCSLSGHSPNSTAVSRYYNVDDDTRRELVAMLE
jgi:site-specific recombinase XerD